MKPTAESVGISTLFIYDVCEQLLPFPSDILVDIDTADLFITAFPFVFVSQPSGKQRLGYDNKTKKKAVINGPAAPVSIGMH